MVEFRPSATLEMLATRARLLREVRAFFDQRGFLEVQTPVLSAYTVVDAHLDPIAVPRDGGASPRWLQTSPELAMKRLIAAGASAIYQITPAFRDAEVGQHHNLEFTMLEWYRVGDDLEAGIALLGELAQAAIPHVRSWHAKSMRAVFEEFAKVDPWTKTARELRQLCRAEQIACPDSLAPDDWDAHFDLLFAHLVQGNLGREAATIVYDYPASQAALARIRPGEPPLAERFELFVDGVELGNGYHELLDAAELAERFQSANRTRVAEGRAPLPEDSPLIDAMEAGLPPCAGVAVGFDRLLMVATGTQSIAEVLAFPTDRA